MLVEPRFLVLPVIALLLVVPLVLPVVAHAFHTDLQFFQPIKSNIGKKDTLIISTGIFYTSLPALLIKICNDQY